MEEEIDLRPYIEAVTRNWIWIIIAAVVAALLALGATFLMTPKYEAKALVAVTEPRQVVQFDPRIKTSEDNQPINAYPELATSDELLSRLLEKIEEIAPEVSNLSTLRKLLSAESGSDPSLIQLSANTVDPEMSAEIVNLWAEIFVTQANEVFGTQGDQQLDFFEEQFITVTEELQQAEQALIDFQTRNRLTILENELMALQQTQADQLAKKRQIALLLQDAESLHDQLATSASGNTDTSAGQLAAILLQLRAFGGVPAAESTTPWQVQVSVDQLSGADRTEQIAFLLGLQETLTAQVQQIDKHLAELEPKMLSVQQAKQQASAEGSRLNRNLTVVEETYTALARKVEEGKITSQNTSSGVRLASRSAVPESTSGPRKLFIIAGAALAGLFVAVFVILVLTWWRSDKPSAN